MRVYRRKESMDYLLKRYSEDEIAGLAAQCKKLLNIPDSMIPIV